MLDASALHADPRRAALIELYVTACAAVEGRRAVRAALAGAGIEGDWWLLAIGKAASAMALGACDVLGARVVRGLVVSRPDHFDAELAALPALECVVGDHPLPGAASLAAGARVLEFAAAAPAGQRVLVLVSGGASSLVEALPPAISADELRRFNEWGIGSGLDIVALNGLRGRISLLKAGRLATALAHTAARALLISDVPGDDPAVIGSGLVRAAGAPAPPAAARAAAGRTPPPPAASGGEPETPGWVVALLTRPAELPPGTALPAMLVATLGDALAAAERHANEQGLSVRRLAPQAAGDALLAAHRFAHELVLSVEDVLLWGGETTVRLPPVPGRGGRNQHFALGAARLIAGHADLVILAAGTDGTDGNSDDAGAVVDGGTVARATAAGRGVEAALAAADSGTCLEASGDLLHTGPTGTNVGDLFIGLRQARPHAVEAE